MAKTLYERTLEREIAGLRRDVEMLKRRPQLGGQGDNPYIIMDHFSGYPATPGGSWRRMTEDSPYKYYGIHDPDGLAGFSANVGTGVISWTGFGLYHAYAWTLYEGTTPAKAAIALNQAPAGTFRVGNVYDADAITGFTRMFVDDVIPFSTLAPVGADALGGFSYQGNSVVGEVYHDRGSPQNFSYLRIAVYKVGDASGTYTEP